MKLRFSIRDLLWLTIVVALAAGWWLNVVWLQRLERNLSEDALKKTIKTAITEHGRETRAAEKSRILERQNQPEGPKGGKGRRIGGDSTDPPPSTSR